MFAFYPFLSNVMIVLFYNVCYEYFFFVVLTGCSDPSGEFIAVNMEKEINCVIKKCISEFGMNVLKIVSGGNVSSFY